MAIVNERKSKLGWSYHLYSIWLFTRSDLKTIVVPQSLFGIVAAMALSPEAGWPGKLARVIVRVPRVVLVVWINLLPFAIDNQRRPPAVLEDRHNKPWRTLPSGRMTGLQARRLMLCFYAGAVVASAQLGGLRQCVGLMFLGYCYNQLDLADWSWVTRNAINGLGFCCFASAALEAALGEELTFERHARILEWVAMIGGIVFSTVQTQDMADQVGDKLRGRSSMPMALGDGPARWITAVGMGAWSISCPLFWRAGNTALALAIRVLGSTISLRTLTLREMEADKMTFRLWNLWMVMLYALPLTSSLAVAPGTLTTIARQQWLWSIDTAIAPATVVPTFCSSAFYFVQYGFFFFFLAALPPFAPFRDKYVYSNGARRADALPKPSRYVKEATSLLA